MYGAPERRQRSVILQMDSSWYSGKAEIELKGYPYTVLLFFSSTCTCAE
jgi:hypothetical protein